MSPVHRSSMERNKISMGYCCCTLHMWTCPHFQSVSRVESYFRECLFILDDLLFEIDELETLWNVKLTLNLLLDVQHLYRHLPEGYDLK